MQLLSLLSWRENAKGVDHWGRQWVTFLSISHWHHQSLFSNKHLNSLLPVCLIADKKTVVVRQILWSLSDNLTRKQAFSSSCVITVPPHCYPSTLLLQLPLLTTRRRQKIDKLCTQMQSLSPLCLVNLELDNWCFPYSGPLGTWPP